VKEPALVGEWIDEFGAEHITLSLDVRVADGVPMVSVSGWTEASGVSLWDVAAHYPNARHLLLTDISRDGMLMGPNVELLDDAGERLPHMRIQASGGITSITDLARLRTDGAIIGKAIWDGLIALEEALSLART
jgi:phosphoribosylformimino-5-aminoimidazole carboxamide ribotide isomerase